MNISQLKKSITTLINSNNTVPKKLQLICDFLKYEVEHYNWVGFYFKNGDKNELKLAKFSGEPTEHTIIPFGKGICGQVALSNENFIVPNVNAQDNYISCGFKVKSEIVIPIFVNGENIGQIDIDSHAINPFSKTDEILLEFICKKVSEIL
ncbi:GAF domain-containing protein [Lutibacter sp.]